MRAVVFQGPGEPLEVRDVDRPDCPDHGVVVETEACGVCRSDWHAWQGDWDWLGLVPTPGLVFGHEPVGRVVRVGPDVDSVSEGDLVTNPFNLSDGTCRYCRDGRGNLCQRKVPMGFISMAPGAFAEAYPVRHADFNLVALPDGTDPVDVAGLGCRFATAFHGLVHRVDLTAGDTVAVHGCGGVGLSAVHIADALGATVVAVDIDQSKLDRARELGADHTVDATAVEDVPQAVKKHTEQSRGVGVSVDALGLADTVQNSINALAPGGRHLQIGMTSAEEAGWVAVPVDNMVYDEREFYGSYGMPPNEYEEIFSMMQAGEIDPGKIVSETISLDEVPSTLDRMSDYDTIGIPVVDEF